MEVGAESRIGSAGPLAWEVEGAQLAERTLRLELNSFVYMTVEARGAALADVQSV